MSGGSVLSQRQHCLIGWVCQHSFFPGLKKCTPRQRYVNQQAASWSKVGSSRSVPMVLLSLDFGQEMHPTSRKGQSPSCWTFMFHTGPRSESSGIRWGRPAERHKKQRQRQATQPGENSQKDNLQRRIAKDLQITKLGDDQERRPFSQVAQNGRVIVQHEDNSG